MIKARNEQCDFQSGSIKNDTSKQSSPREFFQRIYGNLEKSKISFATQSEDELGKPIFLYFLM